MRFGRYRSSEKEYAWHRIYYLVKKGIIPSARDLTCLDCGGKTTGYDHADYSKPDCVEPVCQRCHIKREVARGKMVGVKGRRCKKHTGEMVPVGTGKKIIEEYL